MDNAFAFLKNLHSSEGLIQLISQGGFFILVAIIFAETGLLLGFFLPGDSLLVAAGVVSAQSDHILLNIGVLNASLMIAAIIGNQLGYWLGLKTGPKIFLAEDSLFFKKKYAQEAHAFYELHGGKAIVLARFVPILRTFVPFIAGVAQMSFQRFLLFNVIGSLLWIGSLLGIGYTVGKTPLAEKLHYVILVVILVSFLPIAIGVLKRLIAGRKTK
ncbi:MAG: VTT domain-containing protein [Verrucomicrobiota bacterium]